MIPVALKEHVEYTDTDGVVFRFIPKSGEIEQELFDLYRDGEADRNYERLNAFVDRIVLAPKYEKPVSKLYNTAEKFQLLELWHKANRVSVEEKKS